jgi:hypothetical protein
MIHTMRAVASITTALLLVACQAPAVIGSATGCLEPPEEALVAQSGFGLIPEEDTVASGGIVSLRFELPENIDEEIMSTSAAWQCWTEDGWQITHQLFHRPGDVPGEPVGPGGGPLALGAGGATTTEELMGHPVPSVSELRIPRVEPGLYRIVDEVIAADGSALTGVAIIEVVEANDQD